MYKLKFDYIIKEKIEKENINKVKLDSLIQEDIQDREMDEIYDIIFILKLESRDIALIGVVNKNTITFSHLDTNPIIV